MLFMIKKHTTITNNGQLNWYTSSLFSVSHGLFTRSGGISTPPYNSLNLSFGVGDEKENVSQNRERIKRLLGIESLVSGKQVHGDRIYTASKIQADHEEEGCDALITRQTGVGLMIQQADCQAVLLHDPVQQVVAAIHNGWRGSAANIIARTVNQLVLDYSVRPRNLLAVISPSLGPCCAEFVNHEQELPLSMHSFQIRADYFDFWAISVQQLEECGILQRNIESSAICTACNSDFFSYRRAKRYGNGITGRNGSIIALPQG